MIVGQSVGTTATTGASDDRQRPRRAACSAGAYSLQLDRWCSRNGVPLAARCGIRVGWISFPMIRTACWRSRHSAVFSSSRASPSSFRLSISSHNSSSRFQERVASRPSVGSIPHWPRPMASIALEAVWRAILEVARSALDAVRRRLTGDSVKYDPQGDETTARRAISRIAVARNHRPGHDRASTRQVSSCARII